MPRRHPSRSGRMSRFAALAAAGVVVCALDAAAQPAAGQAAPPGSTPATPAPAEATSPITPDMTPMGAMRAGDQYRFVPAWTGGLSEPVKGYEPGRHHPDPFFEDARWFTVKGPADLERYKVRMSEGLRELMRRYPSFEIPMYQARRTAAAPQTVYDATLANAGRARLADNGLAVQNWTPGGIPFPVPKSGIEAMWNHVLRWRGGATARSVGVAIPDDYGQLALSLYREERMYAPAEAAPVAQYYRRMGLRPDAVMGGLLVHETLNPLAKPRAVWHRGTKDKLVRRAGEFAHDTPDPMTDGIRTADMLDMFSGDLDRFEYTLSGRRSMYAPYNAYRLEAPNLAPEDFLWAGHPNPAFLRYELHRVWVVEARLKSGYRHAFPERVYYLDEDSWQIVMADHFGPDGQIARYAEAHGATYSQVPVFAPALEITYDFAGKRYVVSGLDNQEKPPVFGAPLVPANFDPATLAPPRRR